MTPQSDAVGWCRRHGLLAAAVPVALLFAARALLLIDDTSLWRDELSTAYKVFQPSLPFLLNYLRTDSHPPLYYVALWLLGRHLGESALLLRLVSWLAYAAGGLLMAGQAWLLARSGRLPRPERALGFALLLAFTSPFPVRYAIEAKGYAWLVACLALALLCRQRLLLAECERRWAGLVGYGTGLALAAASHYYGLIYAGCLLLVDGWMAIRRGTQAAGPRSALGLTAGVAILPVLAWLVLAVDPAGAGGATSWIGSPDYGLLEDVLARFLGPYPLPKLIGVLLPLGWLLRSRRLRWQPVSAGGGGEASARAAVIWLDQSGLLAGVWLVVLVVAVSWLKPIAFARYFIVLLPGLVVWLSCQLARLEPSGRRVRSGLVLALAVWVISNWFQSFIGLTAVAGQVGPREDSNFRRVSLLAAPYPRRYGLTPRHLTTSDQLLAMEGVIPADRAPWRDLRQLADPELPLRPSPFIVAGTGGERLLQRKVDPRLQSLRQRGFRCRDLAVDQPHVRVFACGAAAAGAQPVSPSADATGSGQGEARRE